MAQDRWNADRGVIYDSSDFFVADLRASSRAPSNAEMLRADLVAKLPEFIDAVDVLMERLQDFPGWVDDVSDEHTPVDLLLGELKTLRNQISVARQDQ